ncbi:hypothetical protein [Marinobacter salarius]|uniref:hypothetical protein n=1 Tax=Marinobacter salarius TaxID=1420917 RepID=UPI003D135DA7
MKVQEMSLFELALEAVKVHRGQVEVKSNAGQFVIQEKLAKEMHRHNCEEGNYKWGATYVRFYHTKQGSPCVVIFDYPEMSLMSLPGWKQYSARKSVEASELVEG